MQAHGAQVRASGDPYFSHPLEVAAILTDLHLDDATIIAAVLHDVIEDTETTREEIDRLFGREIGALVEGLTYKLKRLDLVSKRAVQAENFRKLLLAIAADVRVLLVKLADRLHNMRTLHFVPPEKRARIAEETLDIYAPLAGRMGMQRMREELEDLAFRHLMPDAHATIEARLDDVGRNNKLRIVAIEAEIAAALAAEGIVAEVEGRQKQPYSVWRKMERKQITFEQMSDIFGFRIVVRTLPECYRAIGVVHTRWPTVPGRFKDYISTPKPNDYRSIHTTVVGPGRQRVELQVRTAAMHDIASHGIAAHALYKEGHDLRRHRPAQREQGLHLAAPHHRTARRRVVARGVPGAHQARTVPRPGVLLHTQRAAHRASARRDGDRFRLCRPHRRRQPSFGRQDQRSVGAFADGLGKRRRGRDRPPGGAGAARSLGDARRHRQGARGDPARHPRRDAARNTPGSADRSSRAPSSVPAGRSSTSG